MRVFDISLGQMLWSRRSVLLGLLVGAPVILAGAVRLFAATNQLPVINGAGLNGPTLFGILIWLLFVRFIVRRSLPMRSTTRPSPIFSRVPSGGRPF
jgi:hypothetical protein